MAFTIRINPIRQINIPYGYCLCGCGYKTTIAHKTDNRLGWRKDEPKNYIYNHGHRYKEPSQKFVCVVCGKVFYKRGYRAAAAPKTCSQSCNGKRTSKILIADGRMKNVWSAGIKAITNLTSRQRKIRALRTSKSLKKKYDTDADYRKLMLAKALRNNKKYAYGTRTYYADVLFMSKLEASTAQLLDDYNIDWVYESKNFDYRYSKRNRVYIPDFYLPEFNLIVEVKPLFRLSNAQVQTKANACLDKGYNFLFCTEQDLNSPRKFLRQIMRLRSSVDKNKPD